MIEQDAGLSLGFQPAPVKAGQAPEGGLSGLYGTRFTRLSCRNWCLAGICSCCEFSQITKGLGRYFADCGTAFGWDADGLGGELILAGREDPQKWDTGREWVIAEAPLHGVIFNAGFDRGNRIGAFRT
jgi:hypothetical protein